MCGIAGFVGLEDRRLIKKMCDTIAYRGPDDSGYYLDKNISLGNRRLSIIDVAGGRQPIYNEDGSIVIVFNGEIYNYQSVKDALEKKGHKFKTNSDTETVVHAYEEYGDDCVKHLNGMFAFAIWDSNKKTLFAARDRLGEKPFYYTIVGNKLVFASEIKSILVFPGVKREISAGGLDSFLAFQFVAAPLTIFKDIFKLKPGHLLKFANGELTIKKYWDVTDTKESNATEEHFASAVRQLLEKSVKARLMSEVPLGAFLSGGLDSSIVVSLMSKNSERPVNTFSVGFGLGEKYDETQHAGQVAEIFKTNHKELEVKASAMDVLPAIIWHLDEPISDPASIPTYLMSEATRKKAIVVLTGEGSDEMFAGYRHYKLIKNFMYAGKIPRYLRAAGAFISSGFTKAPLVGKYSKFLGKILPNAGSVKGSYFACIGIMNDRDRKELIGDNGGDFADEILSDIFPTNDIRCVSDFDSKVYMPDDLLMKVDKMTMAHSIEARPPFLDYKFVELTRKIPFIMKLKGFTEKYILRKAFANQLPGSIIKRKKHPFNVPLNAWFGGELKSLMASFFESSELRGTILNERAFDKIIGAADLNKLWPLFILENWYRIYVTPDNIDKPTGSIERLRNQ